jgi:hypothetical protein
MGGARACEKGRREKCWERQRGASVGDEGSYRKWERWDTSLERVRDDRCRGDWGELRGRLESFERKIAGKRTLLTAGL